MQAKEILNRAIKDLKGNQVSEPESSAEFLLRQVLGATRAEYYASRERSLTEKELKKFDSYIKRRLKHEPVDQIVGKVEFWGLDFAITGDVLIPRPETEFLVEKVLEMLKTSNLEPQTLSLLDVGTGAGPIACALAYELKKMNYNFHSYASDVSVEALKVAKKNAKSLGLSEKITFFEADLFTPTGYNLRNIKYNIVTANLPYIPHEDLGGLAFEIHHYEPRVALDGGDGGLVLYERFINELSSYLGRGGFAVCEMGKSQGNRFKELVGKYMPKAKCEIIKDYAGFDRIGLIQS